jgi:threonine dehydrogenase-like Zn-dependent dehydrogenase
MMKAAIVDGHGGLHLADVPEPQLDDYDCLVEMEVFAFCNSTDAHIISADLFGLAYPSVLGHETTGRIVRTGSKVRHFRNGDRVLRAYALYPDEKLGGFGSAWGGFAQRGKVRDWQAMADDDLIDPAKPPHSHAYQQVVPAKIPPRLAVLMIGQKEIYSCVAKIPRLPERGRYLITGAGVTAVLFGQFLRARGDYVAMTARRWAPLQFALDRGSADAVYQMDDTAQLPRDFDALIETTGSISAASRVLNHVRPGGDILAYAVYKGMDDEAIYAPFRAGHRFQRIDPAEASAHDDICKLALSGELGSADLVTHEFPFKEISAAWQTVAQKQSLKTLLNV